PISGAHRPRRDVPAVFFVAVAEGSFRYWTEGRTIDAHSGSLHLLTSGEPIRFAVPEQSRMLLVAVPGAFLPPEVRAATSGTIGEVPATRVTAGLISLVEQVLDPELGGTRSPAARAVRALAVAALEDSVP